MENFPILDVHANNAVAVWPSLTFGINTAEFIAIDLELSGLGNRTKLASKCLDERYAEIGNAAKTRSIISIGISCFKENASQEGGSETKEFTVQTYNILALCSQPFTVEPQALKFLTQHGFDFNKQYQLGLPYHRGGSDAQGSDLLTKLFLSLCTSRKPIVLHNGLVDLIFLYQNLYLNLPAKLSTFLADIEELFPVGIYDTKYLAEYHVRLKASYLQYVFRSCMKWNQEKSLLQLKFLKPPSASEDVYYVVVTTEPDEDNARSQRVCQQYAAHGWCTKGSECTDSHDISLILNCDRMCRNALKNRKRRIRQRERKKKLKTEHISDSNEDIECEVSCDDIANPFDVDSESAAATNDRKGNVQTPPKFVQNCHRAGVDAFMTGFSHAVFTLQLKHKKVDTQDLGNKLYLSGKNLPLQVTKGNFGRVSQAHAEKSKSHQSV